MLFLPQSLIILIDLGLSSPLSQRTTSVGTMTDNFSVHKWKGTSMHLLNVHKSMGPDGIHPRVLKELADVMAGSLSIIYQRSWEPGKVPADWKLVNVVPVYKKGVRKLQTC